MANSKTMPIQKRHWIAERIESLDPYTDYEEIYRLSSSYNNSDFINNMIYGITFPNFIVTEWGARAVWREDGGKVLHGANSRVEATETNNMKWWYYGPSDQRCLDAVHNINALHERLEKNTPNCFNHNEDFIYTLAFSSILGHRLMERLGLPGFTEKQKIASHLFWQELSKHFKSAGNTDLVGYPKSWDASIKYCEDFENSPKPSLEQGHLIAEAIYQQFAFRYFPYGFRWLGRAIEVSISLPTTLATLKVEPINPILKWVLVSVIGWLFFIMSFFPDPAPGDVLIEQQLNAPKEDRIARAKKLAQGDKAFCPYFALNNMNKGSGPYHQAMKQEL